MELHTARLLLREYELTDFEAVHAFASDPRVAEFVDWGPNSEQDTHAFLAQVRAEQAAAPRTSYTLAVVLPGQDPVGSVGLTLSGDGQAELGYVIAPVHWNHGYATEAAAALLAFGRDQLKLTRILATCRPANLGSAKVLRRIGMQRIGLRTRDRLIRGQWQDSLVFKVAGPDGRAEATCQSLAHRLPSGTDA